MWFDILEILVLTFAVVDYMFDKAGISFGYFFLKSLVAASQHSQELFDAQKLSTDKKNLDYFGCLSKY